MDAKPQRIRVRGDENAPVALPPNKTIHQRNKSSPALSAMYQNGAAKNGVKRAAFGDVSNKANLVRLSRDDSSLAGKNLGKGLEKVPLLAQEKRPAALSQPAQRPLSIAGLKGILNNTTNSEPIETTAKQMGVSQHAANTRKTLIKRSNAVFKDPLLPLVESNEVTSKEIMTKAKEVAHQDDSKANVGTTEASHHIDTKSAENCSVEKADDIVGGKASGSKAHEKDSKAAQDVKDRESYETWVTVANSHHSNGVAPKHPIDPLHPVDSLLPHLGYEHGPAPSEPEEYWDDEDYEHEEDDGYTTARSYRSRGDNTTGGATMVLFPKYNHQVRRELALAKEIVEESRTAEDIEDEYWDTSMVAEYSDEIFEYMKEQEIKLLPNAHYMDNQTEIQWSMRSVLMDWLVQVHLRFSLLPETLFLCVNYIDRFLSSKIVSLGKLQLVGATAIFIAAKYEEINCPSVQEIVFMVDGGYTVDEILKAERFMLSMLQFELGWPGPMSFLRKISKADDYDLETRTLAKYFLEITIMDERFVGSPPSFVAAGAHCLARMMLKKGNWTHAHVHYSEYTYSQLLPLISLMYECCENPLQHHKAIYKKYSDKRFKRASVFVGAEIKRGFRIPEISKEQPTFDRRGSLESAYHWKHV